MIHVLDASRSVTVVGALLSDRKADYVEVSVGDVMPRSVSWCASALFLETLAKLAT